MDPQVLADKLEIHELLARYARGVDDRDWDLYRSVFTEDAAIDYTAVGGPSGPRDDVVAFFEAFFPSVPWSQHYITNIEIDLEGDRAEVRAMFYNPMQMPGMDEPSFFGGDYLHDLVRTADGWRSCRLVERSRWSVNPPAGL
jgi:3-phenylpropionate/cinnamic acid dioxygenase small subunit